MSFKSKVKSGVTSRGWPPERRLKQAERLKKLKPWLRSTGPKTRTGKARAAQNAFKHGGRAVVMRKLAHMLALHRRLLRKIEADMQKSEASCLLSEFPLHSAPNPLFYRLL